jgi:hypothetical protein
MFSGSPHCAFFVYQTLGLRLTELLFLGISEKNFEKVEGRYTSDQTLATYPS